MLLIALSLAFALGIFLGTSVSLLTIIVPAVIITLPLLFLARRHGKVLLALLCLVTFIAGALRSAPGQPVTNESHLQFYKDQSVAVKGLVSRDPEVGDKTCHLYLATTGIRLEDTWRSVSGNLLIFAPVYADYRYGDELEVTGKLEAPTGFDGFDYRGYLADQGIYAIMHYPRIETLGSGHGFQPLVWLYRLRNRMSLSLTRVLPEPQASLAQGIILGIRGNIPGDVKTSFSRSGIMHLLAISGVHLSIIAGILSGLGAWLFGRRYGIHILLTLGVIWLYALLVGFQPPVVRSAIMASIFLVAELLGRQRSALTALSFAAAVMLALSPQALWRVSFQMSFLAMVGLILLSPPLKLWGRKAVSITLGEERKASAIAVFVTDSLATALSATLVILPLLAGYFGVIPLMGLPATVLAMPLIPVIIVTGILAGLSGMIVPPLAYVMGWLAWPFLSYLLLIAEFFASFLFSALPVSGVNVYAVITYYLLLALVIWFTSRRLKTGVFGVMLPESWPGAGKISSFITGWPGKWVLPFFLVVSLMVSGALLVTMPDDKLHVSFLDVGQGDAILIRQGSWQVLVDGGPDPQEIAGALGRKMPFWDRDIEMMVLTHPDADHLIGLLEVIKRYRVGLLLSPDVGSDSDVYQEWQRLLGEKNIKCLSAQEGQQVNLDGTLIEVLNPLINSDVRDTDCAVLRVSRGRISFLLTADITSEEELELVMTRANIRSTVLKVAHHGSAYSSSRKFLAVVDPVVAVISVGENEYEHPTDEAIDRLKNEVGAENIYRTDADGTIEFMTDGERLWVKKER
ncbi:MAG: DNA internalization-related competence protein ComEC/Rec2 [Chloroflexota bacterium]